MENDYDVDSYSDGAVIALKFADGVLLGVDAALEAGFSYEPRTFARICRLSKSCVLAASGKHYDLQALVGKLKEKKFTHDAVSDFEELQPAELYHLASEVLYEQRNRFDPLFVNVAVAGAGAGTSERFLGRIDMYGSGVLEDFVCTGRAAYFALPLIRKEYRENMSLEEAKTLLLRCLRVNTSVDPFSSCAVQLAVLRDGDCAILPPAQVERAQ